MFTGIVEEIGKVKSLNNKGGTLRLQVQAPKIAKEVQVGQSICVNGICLTVVQREQYLLSFDVMPETIRRTNLDSLRPTEIVNLERSLKADGRIDGHFVNGHIDGTGTISRKQTQGSDIVMTLKAKPQLLRYIAPKGSVTLDGVSLTISALNNTSFSVNLIPYTLRNTTLGSKRQADVINIECDIIAKYIEKFVTQNLPSDSSITSSFLKEHGFAS